MAHSNHNVPIIPAMTEERSLSPTPGSTHEDDPDRTYVQITSNSAEDEGSPTLINVGDNQPTLPTTNSSTLRPVPSQNPPPVRNMEEQFAWLMFTRDNNKPDPYGTSSTEQARLSLSTVATLYVQRYGGTASQQAISKRLHNENNLRKFYEAYPDYPRNITYGYRPEKKRKAEDDQPEERNQRRRVNNHQDVAGTSAESHRTNLDLNGTTGNSAAAEGEANNNHGHVDIEKEENQGEEKGKGTRSGTYRAGWQPNGTYRPPKHFVEIDTFNSTHLRSLGVFEYPYDDEDAEMCNASDASDKSDDPDSNSDDNNNHEDPDDGNGDNKCCTEESSGLPLQNVQGNNPRIRLDGAPVRNNIVEIHRDGRAVFILQDASDADIGQSDDSDSE
ncbi:hypothetical protein DM02DRAFT_628954 [Periconia macrospinosa]|uniref:Uncharacterized protein n=1 Tax=Periconia macrospinosa TaxID=97972 RepID=A0A2V1DRJ5_9PLEO|nr:hypothetical protein DM02DRAFT_628954 [Periconia macrospinosa]